MGLICLLRTLFPGLPKRLAVIGAAQLTAATAEATFIGLTIGLTASLGGAERAQPGSLPIIAFGATQHLGPAAVLAAALIALLIRAAASAGGVWLWAQGVEEYERRHRGKLLASLLQADWSRQSREPAGRLQHVLTHHAECLSKAFTALAWSCTHIVTTTVLVCGAIVVDPGIAAAGTAALALFLVGLRPLVRRSRAAAGRRADALGGYVHLVAQALGLLREVRVFGAAEALERRADVATAQIGRTRRVQNVIGSTLPVFYQAAACLLLLGGLGWAHMYGGTSGAGVVVCLALLLRAASAAQYLHTTFHQIQDARPFLEEILTTEAAYEAARLPRGGLPIGRIDSLALRKVSFAYRAEQPILSQLDLSARRGEVIAVVGPSGAGKTTLVHLLLQLFAPTHGSLLVNNQPAEIFAAESWFERVAFVPQEPALFHESIEACIRFDRAAISADTIRQAIHDAGLEADVARMPAGLQTLVGERGTDLSFGQRQRVCLARALAGNPDLLILDEPTSALDAVSEELVVQTVERLRGKALVFVVTHRPALLRVCDRIFEVDDAGVRSVLKSSNRGAAIVEVTA